MRHRLLTAVLLLAPLGALAQSPLEAGPLADVRVEGNLRVESTALLSEVRSRAGSELDAERVRTDLQALWSLGYFDDIEVVLLSASEAGLEAGAGSVLVYRVKEKPAVRQVRYEGIDELSKDDLDELLEVKTYAILDPSTIASSEKAFEAKYREKGFYLARVNHRIVPIEGEASVDVVFEVNERSKVEVKEIRFVGNHSVSEKELESVMETREGGLFSFFTSSGTYQEEAFERDLMRISAVYYDRGYINVNVGKPRLALSPDKKYLFVTVTVEEGEPYTIGTLEVSGDLLEERDVLIGRMSQEPGELFVRSKLGEDIMALQARYRDEGYAFVQVTPLTQVHPEEKTIDLDLEVRKGKKVRVERIEIHGHTRTRDKVIRREFRIDEGDLYSGSRITLSQQRVQALGYFENVELSTRPGSADDQIILDLQVKERPTGTFQVGAGVSTGEGLLVTAQIAHDNLFGRGQSISFQWMFSKLRNIFQLQFMEPYFLDTKWTFAFGAQNTRSDFFNFIRSSRGGNLTWGYELVDDLRVFGTYTLEDVNVSASDGAVDSDFYGGGITSSLKGTISYDTRDNRLFPTRGQYHTLSAEVAAGKAPLFSQNKFQRLSLVSRFFHPLPFGVVFRFKGELGMILGDEDEYPGSERYFLGGVFNIRGYPLRTLSPTRKMPGGADPLTSTIDFPVGGNKQAVFNLELEFPLLPPVGIRGVVFYDAGNAYATEAPWFTDEQYDLPLGMFHSVGFGIRWFSPIGPLRFEWGIPLYRRLDRNPQDQRIRFEFMVGNAF
ncbi:MAG: outer membrane protein assembly factor BamA [Deltaproteobacteria bacterium]|nr:outer membrane protein assembly factor BamA [Deltaproteobacteria bacterium]